MDPADEFYDAVDWPWEERNKIDEEKQQLKMERQSLDRDLNQVEDVKKSVQWEHQQLEHEKSIYWERAQLEKEDKHPVGTCAIRERSDVQMEGELEKEKKNIQWERGQLDREKTSFQLEKTKLEEKGGWSGSGSKLKTGKVMYTRGWMRRQEN